MEDAVTAAAPPSRFFPDDLDVFSTPTPSPLPPPLLLLSPEAILPANTLLLFLSSPSRSLLPPSVSVPLAGTLILPETPLAPASLSSLSKIPSFPLYQLKDKSAIAAVVRSPIPEARAHKVADVLLSGIKPERVVILDSVKVWNYRGRIDTDGVVECKLETQAKRAKGGAQDRLMGDLEYYPSGSLVDGLGAALLAACQMRGLEGSLVAMWPEGARAREFSVLRRIAGEYGLDIRAVAADGADGTRPSNFDSDLYS